MQRFSHTGLLLVILLPGLSAADGIKIDKVYHPYVQPLETELEIRNSTSHRGDDNLSTTRVGLGTAVTPAWYTEFYLIGKKQSGESFALEAVELEAKWQITEQGEYESGDWGLLLELEKLHSKDAGEIAASLLHARDLRRWTITTNVSVIYEWNQQRRNEWETAAATQLKYRYRPGWEPALELYLGEDSNALGPVMMGRQRFTGRRQLHWELGLLFGLDHDSPDQTLRLLLEYEF